jgi:hypothetical protein
LFYLYNNNKSFIMSKFPSFWGDIEARDENIIPSEENKKPTAPAKVGEVDEEEGAKAPENLDKTEKDAPEKTAEELAAATKATEDSEAAKAAAADDVDEIEITEDDVNKAYNMLLDEGVLEEEEGDDFDVTPAGIADKVAASVRKKFDAELAAIPAVVNDFYQHVLEGNDPKEFKPQEKIMWSEFSTEDDEASKQALRVFYKRQKMTDEDIEEEIADHVAAGKLKKKADIAVDALSEQQVAQDAAQVTAQAASKKKADEAKAKEVEDLHKTIDDLTEVAEFKLTKEMKAGFKDYLFKPQARTGKTKMQENMADEERRLRIAFLDYMDYNKEDVAKGIKTDLTKKHRKRLTRFSSTGIKNKNAASVKARTDNKSGAVKFPTLFGGSTVEVED